MTTLKEDKMGTIEDMMKLDKETLAAPVKTIEVNFHQVMLALAQSNVCLPGGRQVSVFT